MKQARSLPILALSLLLMPFAAHAQSSPPIKAASCSQSDVNAVINGPVHTAVNGDTIQIPAGTCTWTSGVKISGVGITITGTGTPNTGAGTVGAGTPSTTIIDNVPNSSNFGALFSFTGLTLGQTAKVELLILSASGAATNAVSHGPINFTGTCTASGCANIRVDNIVFSTGTWENPLAGSGMVTVANVFGVVDHNTANEATSGSPPLVQINYPSWQGVGDYGDNSFASGDTLGTAQSMFIENNLLTGVRGSENDVPPAGANSGGARYVCRFNTVVDMSGTGVCSAHGTAWSGRPRGQRQVESYYNNVTIGSAGCNAVDGLNAGVGYYFSNSISAPGGGCNEFVDLDIPTFIKTAAPWGNCDGTGAYDQVPFSSTSACIDQVGSGAGTLLQGLTPILVALGVSGWPNPAHDPIYEAGEKMTAGGLGTPVVVASDGSSSRILANRDYYAEVSQSAQSSPTSPFNGTTGTGYGTLANRPPSCTAGVGYWATDQGSWNQGGNGQGVLFICGASGWPSSPNYTPYTYPHPLTTSTGAPVSQVPNPPTALIANPQ